MKSTAIVVAVGIFLAGPAAGQIWSSGYFNTNDGYVAGGSSLDGQPTNAPASEQWQTTDPYTTNQFVGSSSLVWFITNYTPGLEAGGNNSVSFGGFNATNGYLPGITNPVLYRGFTNPGLGASLALIDFAFIGPSTNLSLAFTNKDYFSFDLANSDRTGSLAKFTLNPFGGSGPDYFAVNWIQNGTNVVADGSTFKAVELQYNALYRIVASLAGTNVSLDIQGLSPQSGPGVGITNYLISTNFNVVSNGAISTNLNESEFENLALEWNLSSGDTNAPGANYLVVTTVSVVPEPSTFALLAVAGLTAGAVYLRRRRRS